MKRIIKRLDNEFTEMLIDLLEDRLGASVLLIDNDVFEEIMNNHKDIDWDNLYAVEDYLNAINAIDSHICAYLNVVDSRDCQEDCDCCDKEFKESVEKFIENHICDGMLVESKCDGLSKCACENNYSSECIHPDIVTENCISCEFDKGRHNGGFAYLAEKYNEMFKDADARIQSDLDSICNKLNPNGEKFVVENGIIYTEKEHNDRLEDAYERAKEVLKKEVMDTCAISREDSEKFLDYCYDVKSFEKVYGRKWNPFKDKVPYCDYPLCSSSADGTCMACSAYDKEYLSSIDENLEDHKERILHYVMPKGSKQLNEISDLGEIDKKKIEVDDNGNISIKLHFNGKTYNPDKDGDVNKWVYERLKEFLNA